MSDREGGKDSVEELKPCPVCGKAADVFWYRGYCYVRCDDRHAFVYAETVELARQKWDQAYAYRRIASLEKKAEMYKRHLRDAIAMLDQTQKEFEKAQALILGLFHDPYCDELHDKIGETVKQWGLQNA